LTEQPGPREHPDVDLIAATPLSWRGSAARPTEDPVPTRPTAQEAHGLAPVKDRRAAPAAKGAAGLLRRLKGVLARPLKLQRHDGRLRLVLVERRQARPVDGLPSLSAARDELRALLMLHGNEHATGVMRHLVLVHDELGRRGWPGVEALPVQVLGMALVQAEMLASDESTEALSTIIDRLRIAKVAAELREEQASSPTPQATGAPLEVSEVPRDEFDELARDDWVDTTPPSDLQPKRAPGAPRS
jgi:hypothetical protein